MERRSVAKERVGERGTKEEMRVRGKREERERAERRHHIYFNLICDPHCRFLRIPVSIVSLMEWLLLGRSITILNKGIYRHAY